MPIVNCKNCQKTFEKRLGEFNRGTNHFCSRSCSAKFNNLGKRKNPPIDRICRRCGTIFKKATNRSSRLLCSECSKNYSSRTEYLKSLTRSEYQNRPSVKNKHRSWQNAHVRALNRNWNKDKITQCRICGYSLHVELAHIKSVNSFPESATLGEINHPDNVLPLCPNHHWEFDNGFLQIS